MGAKVRIHSLSIKQPWLWLIMHGKTVENRVWRTTYRGPLVLHSSAKAEWTEVLEAELLIRARNLPIKLARTTLSKCAGGNRVTEWPAEWPLGKLCCLCYLVDCVHEHPSPYFVGPYGLALKNIIPLPEPIPMRGHLRIRPLDAMFQRMIAAQIPDWEERVVA